MTGLCCTTTGNEWNGGRSAANSGYPDSFLSPPNGNLTMIPFQRRAEAWRLSAPARMALARTVFAQRQTTAANALLAEVAVDVTM